MANFHCFVNTSFSILRSFNRHLIRQNQKFLAVDDIDKEICIYPEHLILFLDLHSIPIRLIVSVPIFFRPDRALPLVLPILPLNKYSYPRDLDKLNKITRWACIWVRSKRNIDAKFLPMPNILVWHSNTDCAMLESIWRCLEP